MLGDLHNQRYVALISVKLHHRENVSADLDSFGGFLGLLSLMSDIFRIKKDSLSQRDVSVLSVH